MIDYAYKDLFMDDSVSKQLIIEYNSTVITNEDLFDQTMTLEESLCSEQELRFGSCEASVLKFKVANIVAPMKDKWITVKIVLEGHTDEPFIIGRYKVEEDKVTSDRLWRDITAYDAMHDIINADMAAWYNNAFPTENTTMTMAQFRTSFISHFGLEQVVPESGLVNDNMIITKTIAITATEEEDTEYGRVSVVGESLSGRDIITAICEINGCFGHIGRDGKFQYIYLQQDIMGIYPANFLFPDRVPDEWNYLPQAKTGHLYPQDPKGAAINKNYYIPPPKCDDYMVQTIEKVQIREEENDIGGMYPSGEMNNPNTYIIEDNFLVYGKGTKELNGIAQNIFSKIKDVIYRPFDVDCKGNLCFEVGDAVRMPTKYRIIETYILQRTLKGIQALRDAYSSTGVEKYSEQVNGTQYSIKQLKGKANILTRNAEETRLQMIDIEAGLKNEIKVTAEGLQANITAEEQRATGEETKLSNSIKATAEGLQVNITKEQQRAQGEETRLSTSITALAGQIILKVNSNGDIAMVQLSADPNDGTTFKVKVGNLQLSAEEVINIMAGGNLNLSGKNIKISADNFSVSADGTVRCYKIVEFGVEGNARSSFNGYVANSPAVTDLTDVYNRLNQNQQQIQTTVNNLNNTIIPQINNWIKQLSGQLQALGQPGIS